MTQHQPSRPASIAAAVGGGLGVGLLGTALHGHLWYPGNASIPLGALGALVLLAAVVLFVGLWSRSGWVAMLAGVFTYITAGVLSLQIGSYGLISGNLQGELWLYGIAVVTPLASLLCLSILRRSARGR